MSMLSKSAIALGDGEFTIGDVKISDPLEDEVIVKIKAAGICHTDYDSLSWGKPIVMGHEGAGIVHSVGSNVIEFAKGDHVILNWGYTMYEMFSMPQGKSTYL